MTDPRVVRGMQAQLARWRRRIAGGAARVGWKIGFNSPAAQRQLGLDGTVVGHLTQATVLAPGTSHSLAGSRLVSAEPEVAVHLGRDVPAGAGGDAARAAIAALGAAIELVDIDGPLDDLEAILAANVFHRAAVLGPPRTERAGGALAGVTARAFRNGDEVASVEAAAAAGDLAAVVRHVADWLAAFGERLCAGDRIICGSLAPPIWV
ncbi:MAG: hypothetical protein E6J59_00085, partial [Deltaproteobacteria bacterium]